MRTLITLCTVWALYASQSALTVGSQAAPIDLRSLDNSRKVDWEEFKGKWVLVDFWATWCPPCVKSLPKLQYLSTQRPELKFLLVNLDLKPTRALRFLKLHEINLLSVYDGRKKAAEAYEVNGMPTLLLIDPTGKIRLRLDGYDPIKVDDILDSTLTQWMNPISAEGM